MLSSCGGKITSRELEFSIQAPWGATIFCRVALGKIGAWRREAQFSEQENETGAFIFLLLNLFYLDLIKSRKAAYHENSIYYITF